MENVTTVRRKPHERQTDMFDEKLLKLLQSFELQHETSVLNNPPLNAYAAAIYDFYDGRCAITSESHKYRFADVLRVILENCQADEGEASETIGTFEGTLRANFIEMARDELQNLEVFTAEEALELGPQIAPPTPQGDTFHIEMSGLLTPETAPFDVFLETYPEERAGLIRDLNGSCLAVIDLFNGKTQLSDDPDSSLAAMRTVLAQCPQRDFHESQGTARDALREKFKELFTANVGSLDWEPRVKQELATGFGLKVSDFSREGTQKKYLSPKRKPSNKAWSFWTVAFGIFATYMAYRCVAEPLYQWIRNPKRFR